MSSLDRVKAEDHGASLANAMSVLRRRWLVIAGVLVACIGVSALKHERSSKSYEATASVRFQSGTLSDSALQVSTSGGGEPQREADTEVLVAHSPEVAQGVRRQLRLPESTNQLLDEVKVEAAQNADVLNIIASTGNARQSALLANAFARQYIAFRATAQLAGVETAESKLQQQLTELPAGSAERLAVQQSVQRLNSLRAVAGGGASIIGLASPPSTPSGMRLSTAVIVGLLVGLAISFSLVFLLESLDRRIKSIEEVEREYRLSVLTAIPQSAFSARLAVDRGELLEPHRILRSALDFAAVSHQLDTLLVTSAISGEGKTTVAVDLAHAIALTGRHTVLVELDLRRPSFAKHFDLDPSRGLTTVLVGAESLEDVLVEPFPNLPNLSVLPAGSLPQNPSELLSSPRVSDIISELATPEGIVIIDAAPLNPVADTQVLLLNETIHATLIVARVGQTTRDEIRLARTILDRQMITPIGVVTTGLRDAHRYGYGAYAGEAPTLDVDIARKAPAVREAPVGGRVKSGGLRR